MSEALTGDQLRALDCELAEKAFGYGREVVPPDARGENGGGDFLVPPGWDWNRETFTLPPRGAISLGYLVPQWSERRETAFELLDRMSARGFAFFALTVGATDAGRACYAVFMDLEHDRAGVGTGATEAVAIVGAALEAGTAPRKISEVPRRD